MARRSRAETIPAGIVAENQNRTGFYTITRENYFTRQRTEIILTNSPPRRLRRQKGIKVITVKQLVGLMNIYYVSLAQCSREIPAPEIFGEIKLNMMNQEADKTLEVYGDFPVKQITNIAGLGVTIWV